MVIVGMLSPTPVRLVEHKSLPEAYNRLSYCLRSTCKDGTSHPLQLNACGLFVQKATMTMSAVKYLPSTMVVSYISSFDISLFCISDYDSPLYNPLLLDLTVRITKMPKRKREASKAKPRRRRKDLPREWMQKYAALGPQGFYNSGNTCYRLSLLQCLLHTPVFLRWIEIIHKAPSASPPPTTLRRSARIASRNPPPRITHTSRPTHPAGRCVLCSFQALIQEYWITRRPGAFPESVYTGVVAALWQAMLANIVRGETSDQTAEILRSQDQQDPEEFWSVLLEMLGNGSEAWYEFTPCPKSSHQVLPLTSFLRTTNAMFMLEFITERNCKYCGRPCYDPNPGKQAVLALPMSRQHNATLDACLDAYFVEHVESNEPCPHIDCRSHGHTVQQSTPDSLFNEAEENDGAPASAPAQPSPGKSTPDSLFDGSIEASANAAPQHATQKSSPNSLFDEPVHRPGDHDDNAGPAIAPPRRSPLPPQRIDAIRIVHAPDVLLVTLKRYDYSTGILQKLSTVVPHPLELDLARFAHPAVLTRPLRYRLQGIVCHRGKTVRQGHYVAVVRERNGVGCAVVSDQLVVRHRDLEVLQRPWRAMETHDADVYCLMYMRVLDEA
nr:ubiquitin carboxyl-terminal hydrolase 10 [Quercus suber]